MHFFYVLVNGVTWKLASKLISGTHKFEKTLNRIFNKFSKNNIFSNFKDEITFKYIEQNKDYNLIIDSTDIINANCNKNELGKSWKLHKQGIKATFIIDNNKVPIAYSLDNPTKHDCKVGYDLIMNSKLSNNKNKRLYVSADKGYILNKKDSEMILKYKNIIFVTPKKKYKKSNKKNKYYKRKIVRHSKQMKEILKDRIYVEHFNSTLHRSYKRLDKIFDKSLNTFKTFIDIALSIIILQKLVF